MTELDKANQRIAALEAELAAMRATGEPVSYYYKFRNAFGCEVWSTNVPPNGQSALEVQPLYTHPSPPERMAVEPVAIRPDIQAVLAMLDVPVIAHMSSHEGKLLKPGQEPPAFESAVPLVREWDHRRACETIIAALSGNN